VALLASSTSYADLSTTTGQRYYYAITAVDAAGNESQKSAEVSAIAVENVAPAAPTGVTATGGSRQVALSWTANPEADIAGYDVYRNGVKANGAVVTGTTYTDVGLADATTYTYSVRALDASGNRSPDSATVAATTAQAPAAFDGTFEGGTDGAILSSPWTIIGVPLHAEYDSLRAKQGSLSGWIQGPASTAFAGIAEGGSGGMAANGAELRFWIYFDATNTARMLDDCALAGTPAADRAFMLYWGADGKLSAYTDRTGNPNGYTTATYTSLGTYATGWTEYRIQLTYTGTNAQTYTLSKRSNATDAWTSLKASAAATYQIPFRGANTITQTHGTVWRGNSSGSMWLDDLRFSNSGIVDPDTAPPSAPSGVVAIDHPGDTGGAIDLSWSASSDNVGVTGYKVYRGTAPGVYGTPVTLLASTQSYTDPAATPGTRYYYALTAVDAAGNESPKSAEVSAVSADNVAPAAPTGLAALGGTGQVSLSWTASTELDISGYDLYRGGVKVNTALITATTYADNGRADGTTYSYYLRAVDAAGNASAPSATVSATTLGTPASSFDGTFEGGTDGAALSSPWTTIGIPMHAEYDSLRAEQGSLSGWIRGPASTAFAGIAEGGSGGMAANGAELRFWIYFDATNTARMLDDCALSGTPAADRAFMLYWGADGKLSAYTDRTGNPNGYQTATYTSLGTYATGWTEYRIALTYSGTNAQTYTLSKRSNASDAWTPLKASAAANYQIPFRGANTITQTHGTVWRGNSSGSMWLDDLRFSNSGL